jgi:hypothetical protein
LTIDSRFIPLRQFFLRQSLILPSKECLRELAHVAANDPLFFIELSDKSMGAEDS